MSGALRLVLPLRCRSISVGKYRELLANRSEAYGLRTSLQKSMDKLDVLLMELERELASARRGSEGGGED
jgi:hypothetical protein